VADPLFIGRRSWIIIFLWLFLQVNHLRGRANEVVVKRFFHLRHDSMRAIQVPNTSHQMHEWKLYKLHARAHTNTRVVVDPISKESQQSILHNKLMMNILAKWKYHKKNWSGRNETKRREYRLHDGGGEIIAKRRT